MADQLQLRGGTTTEHSTFTGALREVTVDTDKDTLIVHDAATAGGHPLLREDGSNSALSLGTAGTPSIKFTGDTNTGIYSPGADQVAISTGGSARLYIAADGDVGVGTTSPTSLLHVNGISRFEDFLRGNSTANKLYIADDVALTATKKLYLDGGSNTYIHEASADNIAVVTLGNERLRIDSSGRVGVGTSSPSAKAHIYHTSGLPVTSGTTQTHGALRFGAGGTNCVLDIGNAGASGAWLQATNQGSLIPSNSFPLLLNPNGGNVGVGTTSPAALITVAGASGTGIDLDFPGGISTGTEFSTLRFTASNPSFVGAEIRGIHTNGGTNLGVLALHTSGSEKLRIDSSGRVGIGTSSPVRVLHAVADGAPVARFERDTSDGAVVEVRDFNNNTVGTISTASATVGFYGSGGGGLNIDSSNRVGIGTTSPGYKLHVDNATTTDAAYLGNGYGGLVFGCNSSGERIINTNASGPILFQRGGTESVRIDSSGRLLVGTSSARSGAGINCNLQVEGTGATDSSLSLIRNSANAAPPYLVLGKSRGTALNSNTVVQNNDILGSIEFAAADGNDIASTGALIKCEIDGTPGSNDTPGRLVFSTTADSASSPTERMRINSRGNIFIGTGAFTTNTSRFEIASSTNEDYALALVERGGSGMAIWTRIDGSGSSTNAVRFFDGPSGTSVGDIVTNSSSTSYNTSSDYRLKENVVNLDGAIERVKQLAPKRFNFIVDADKTVDGFLAHEAQTVVPEAVTGTKDAVDVDGNPVYQGIDQAKLVPLLTAALQEAIAKIETLEAKVAALEAN